MQRKILISISLLAAFFVFSCSYSFANTNVMNTVEGGMKNFASDAGNAINNGANAVRDGVGHVENGVENVASDVFGGTNATRNNTAIMGGTNNNYTATRTSTNNATFLGMTANAWTWLIMGILAVAIVALVWFYGRQHSNSYTNDSQR